LKKTRERFKQLESIGEPAFLYGSHFSSPGVVLFYLMRFVVALYSLILYHHLSHVLSFYKFNYSFIYYRLEPYTSYIITMQGGSFDKNALRLFWSMEDIWMGVNNNAADVKELVLTNVSSLHFSIILSNIINFPQSNE
jgi:hypothetical protein